jgi:CRP-like cAMP-binding protein
MTADGIWGNIFRLGPNKQTLTHVLHAVPLFQDLTPKELRILESLVHVRNYQSGESVFRETEPGAGMYVILSGHVDIRLDDNEEQSLVLAELQTGDFFGEMALLGDGARSATAVCRGETELIGFFHPDLQEILNLHPIMGAKIAFGLAKTLAERLRYTNGQLRGIRDIRGTHETSLG